MTLETVDLAPLMQAGYKHYPEAFTVKADDGIADLYGVMYRPFDFDAKKKYPMVEVVYPGPQTEAVNKTFTPRSASLTLHANLSFIVIEIGNRGGNPHRSKWYHTYGYGNLRDYGLADKKRAAEELADRYPFIDIDRVGITGHLRRRFHVNGGDAGVSRFSSGLRYRSQAIMRTTSTTTRGARSITA